MVRDFTGLFTAIAQCERCDLFHTRQKAVLPEGNLRSPVMMIAQAPGEQENKNGRMFIGPSGKLFDELLAASAVNRKDFYLTNLIKCMLPKSRRPSRAQWDACTPWLETEIHLVRPKVFVPLGFQATRFLLIHFGLPRPPRKEYKSLFGKYLRIENVLIYPLRHPTALLFNPDKKEIMVQNYHRLKEIVNR